jgi:hypothetical protein
MMNVSVSVIASNPAFHTAMIVTGEHLCSDFDPVL